MGLFAVGLVGLYFGMGVVVVAYGWVTLVGWVDY